MNTSLTAFVRTADADTVLASIPSPSWQGFSIGPFTVHAYALCILIGIVLATWITATRWKRKGGPSEAIPDILLWAVPFGIIGGRLYHVIFTAPQDYFPPTGNPWLIPQIWLGGLGIFGAITLGTLGAWIACRRAGVSLLALLDCLAPGLLIAQAAGRWGNWFNHELFGSPTTLPWGLEIESTNPAFPSGLPEGTLFHPTFLYESLWNLVGIVVILSLEKLLKLDWGRVFAVYLMYYGLGRTLMETLRIDPAEIVLGLRVHMWISVLVILLGLIMFAVQGWRHKRPQESVYLTTSRTQS